MRLSARYLLTAVLVLSPLIGTVHAAPEKGPITLPLESDAGMQRLRESTESGSFHRLVRYFSPQQNLAYCGVASSVMVLNALPVPKPTGGSHGEFPFYTQENFFSPEAVKIKSPELVAKEGMSLHELTALLNVHPGVKAERVPALDSSLERFRRDARATIGTKDAYILTNYHRKPLQQQGGGHISPIGAYHEASDSFLIMDVSQYKYAPVWVAAEDLWNAMYPVDRSIGVMRGYVIVKAG